ncbi:aminodeoxychorismate/anthranilate synthase component II [candidate division KSB1 bacterium]|nr:aminodeoxychorismate/anthranilate synthase component II [candidate division KSB1 bacterium]
MLFMLDNYDSFVYNLYQYFGMLGEIVEVRRNDKVTIPEIEAMNPSAIVVSPGPCTPDDAGISLKVIRHFTGKLPILGVCLGHQSIGQAFGGHIIRAPEIVHGKVSKIHHDGKTVFSGLENPFIATRYHSLIIERESLPECFEVSAWTEEGLIMGVRHKEYPIEGVQFHPESILTESGMSLLKNFLELRLVGRTETSYEI